MNKLKVYRGRFGKIKQVSEWNSKGQNPDIWIVSLGCDEKEQILMVEVSYTEELIICNFGSARTRFLRGFSCDNNIVDRDTSETFLFEVWLWEQTLGFIGKPVLTLSRIWNTNNDKHSKKKPD